MSGTANAGFGNRPPGRGFPPSPARFAALPSGLACHRARTARCCAARRRGPKRRGPVWRRGQSGRDAWQGSGGEVGLRRLYQRRRDKNMAPATLTRPPLRCRQSGLEVRLEVLAGVALGDEGDILGRAGGDDLAAAVAAFRAEIDDPVGGLDDLEVVLDDEHRVPGLHERVKHLQELADILEMEAGGWL